MALKMNSIKFFIFLLLINIFFSAFGQSSQLCDLRLYDPRSSAGHKKPYNNRAKTEYEDYMKKIIPETFSGYIFPSEVLNTHFSETHEEYRARLEKYYAENASFLEKSSRTADQAKEEVLSFTSKAATSIKYSDYCDCILKEISGTQSDIAAKSIQKNCSQSFDGEMSCSAKKWKFFGASTAEECIAKHAKNTTSEFAARMIQNACHRMY